MASLQKQQKQQQQQQQFSNSKFEESCGWDAGSSDGKCNPFRGKCGNENCDFIRTSEWRYGGNKVNEPNVVIMFKSWRFGGKIFDIQKNVNGIHAGSGYGCRMKYVGVGKGIKGPHASWIEDPEWTKEKLYINHKDLQGVMEYDTSRNRNKCKVHRRFMMHDIRPGVFAVVDLVKRTQYRGNVKLQEYACNNVQRFDGKKWMGWTGCTGECDNWTPEYHVYTLKNRQFYMRWKRGCEWYRFDKNKMELIKQQKERNNPKTDHCNDDEYSSYGGYYSDHSDMLLL